jgi:hypothetical protein
MGFEDAAAIPRDVQDFLLHWQGVPKSGLFPRLQDFLDTPPFRLQSEVAIVDVHPDGAMRVRLFGTGLSSLAGDWTGKDALSNFHPAARTRAMYLSSTAVTRPCGYFVKRYLRRGVVETSCIGIGLPLLYESGDVGLVIFCSLSDRSVQLIPGDVPAVVTDAPLMRWIDIGAGVPD